MSGDLHSVPRLRDEMRAGAAVIALVVLVSMGGAVAAHPRAASTGIITISQSSHVTEQGNLTVDLEVVSTSSVSFAYFTFCQLGAPYTCFSPIAMIAHNSSWFVGVTKPMASYQGCPGPCMPSGALGGFNVTIEFKNGTNLTEPTGPTSFPGLTVVKSVAGFYEYQMSVAVPTYGLTGAVSNSATGAPLTGAVVTLTPPNKTVVTTTTSSAGNYGFSNLPNGTYSLSASEKGYRTVNVSLEVAGSNLVKNVALANSSTPPNHPAGSSNAGFFSTPVGWATLGAIAVIVVVAVLVGYSRGRKGRPPSVPPTSPAPSDPTIPQPAEPK